MVVDLPVAPDVVAEVLFRGPGAARALARSIDWSTTPLGAVRDWPQSLRTAVDMCLASRFPTALLWGPELLLIHNEAHIPFLGMRYPAAMGRPAPEVLIDTWPAIGPLVAKTLADDRRYDDATDAMRATGAASELVNVALPFDRGTELRTGYLTLSVSAVRDESGRASGVVIAAVDVAARVFAEAELRASEARFRALAETSPLGVGVSSLDGEIIYTNRAYEEILGAEPGTLIGQPCAVEYYDPADREAWVVAMNDRRVVTDFEVRFRRQDDSPVWVSMNIAPIEFGGRQAIIAIVHDVTGRKRAEAVAERERTDRERDVLRRQLAAAEEGERRRLALELHDQLGQELTAFRLGLDDAARRAAKHEVPDVALLSRLTQLQDLAGRMTTGVRAIALELRPPELDDVGLASAVETYVREWSARYGVAAEVATTGLRDHPVPVEVGSAIYRIAQEALTNVAKHAHATEVSVIVDQTDGEVCLIIEDNGRGFDVEETTARTRMDRRLGLAGMQERAALAGGSVTLESSDGSGTTLYVRLPISKSAAPANELVLGYS